MSLRKVSAWASTRGWGAVINLLVTASLTVLTLPLFDHYSTEHFFLSYSRGYTLFLAAFTVPLIGLGVAPFVLSARRNRVLACAVVGAWALMEATAIVNDQDPASRFSRFYRHPVPYVMFTGLPKATWTTPGVEGDGSDGQPVTYALNRQGFRGEDPIVPKPPGEYRIVMLGGSVVFNGVPLEQGIAGQLERQLVASGHANAKVYNWGLLSCVSGQELALLTHRVADLAPDLVIVFDGYTDVSQPYDFDPRPGYPINFVTVEEGLDRIENQAPTHKLVATLLYKSRALRTIYSRSQPDLLVPIGRARDEARYRTPAWELEIVRIYLNNLDKMVRLSKAFDFKIATFVQPSLVLKKARAGRELDLPLGGEFDGYLRRQYARVQAGVASLARQHAPNPDVGVFDLSGFFTDSADAVYSDFVHISNQANGAVAGEMSRRIRERAWIP